MFSYISVVATGYILLVSVCPMLKARKMKSMASSSLFANFFKNYFWVQKLVPFYLYKNFIDCFVLEFATVGTMSRF